MMYNILAIATIVLYMLPWLMIHGWVLYNNLKTIGDTADETKWQIAGVLLVLGVVPIMNLILAWYMFGEEQWIKLKEKVK